MILGAEIGLIIYGLYAIFKASYSIGKNRHVTGGKARILGVIALTPIPLAFITGIIAAVILALLGNADPNPLVFTAIEVIIVIGVVVLLTVLGKIFYNQQEAEKANDPYSPDMQ